MVHVHESWHTHGWARSESWHTYDWVILLNHLFGRATFVCVPWLRSSSSMCVPWLILSLSQKDGSVECGDKLQPISNYTNVGLFEMNDVLYLSFFLSFFLSLGCTVGSVECGDKLTPFEPTPTRLDFHCNDWLQWLIAMTHCNDSRDWKGLKV